MSENTHHIFPGPKSGILSLVLSEKTSITQRYSIQYHGILRKKFKYSHLRAWNQIFVCIYPYKMTKTTHFFLWIDKSIDLLIVSALVCCCSRTILIQRCGLGLPVGSVWPGFGFFLDSFGVFCTPTVAMLQMEWCSKRSCCATWVLIGWFWWSEGYIRRGIQADSSTCM